MKYLQGNYKVEAASATLLLNKALKKMTTDGRLVAGAQAGKSGAGCYKVSMEEKTRINQVEKASAKKRAAAEKGAAATRSPWRRRPGSIRWRRLLQRSGPLLRRGPLLQGLHGGEGQDQSGGEGFCKEAD